MKPCLSILFLCTAFIGKLYAQAPTISYTGPQVYAKGSPITPLTPLNKGGVVPLNLYGQVSTIAGSGIPGANNGTGAAATFNGPSAIAIDAAGNLYVTESINNLVRKITPTGAVTTFAGSGTPGNANGTGANASFRDPEGLTLDAAGNIYVSDFGNHLIRKITPNGVVTTFAGNGVADCKNGTVTTASFDAPRGILVNAAGDIFVAEYANDFIKKISGGLVTTYAGKTDPFTGGGVEGNATGPLTTATFFGPTSLAYDAAGNMYVTDLFNSLVRKINTSGIVSNYAGNGLNKTVDGPAASASFSGPWGIATDPAGNVYVSTTEQNIIRKISTDGIVSTLAGGGPQPVSGIGDGVGTAAVFGGPSGLISDASGNLYVADARAIRKVTTTGYSISPALPAGLNMDGTGVITGTPTVASPTTIYTITAYNASGSSKATLSITVASSAASPVITASTSTGTITACAGTASASPNIQKFTVSGSNLTSGITVTAPAGFEVSTQSTGNFSSSATVLQSNGTANSTAIYVRSAQSDLAGNISGNVTVSSPGVASQTIAITGTVNALPTFEGSPSYTVAGNLELSFPPFRGTASTYNWINDNPAIGLPASGTGNLPSFVTPVNNGNNNIIARITVTPVSASGCAGTPATFTILIVPTVPTIVSTPVNTSFTTAYGNASTSASFSIQGIHIISNISVTPPAGFEVSTDNIHFNSTVSVGNSGTVPSTTVYIRLSSTASPGNHSGGITLTSGIGLTTIDINGIVTLPPNNFKLTITSATCKGNSDGSVNITAAQSLAYTATITGNGLNTPYPFTTSKAIDNLAAGSYQVCITVAGQPDYSQCYDAVITEPKDLSVYSVINMDNSLTLTLSGGSQYNVILNGTVYTTNNSSITLPLAEGNNDLAVTTDRLCQGSFKRLINISGKITPYPVPFQNTLSLNVGNTTINNVSIEIHDAADGKLVYNKKYVNQSGVVQLDLTNLQGGVYALHLSMDNSDKIFKIIKK